MLRKVLLLSATAGAGHVRAAQAIEKAFKETGNGESEVQHVDVLNYTNKCFDISTQRPTKKCHGAST